MVGSRAFTGVLFSEAAGLSWLCCCESSSAFFSFQVFRFAASGFGFDVFGLRLLMFENSLAFAEVGRLLLVEAVVSENLFVLPRTVIPVFILGGVSGFSIGG